MWILACPLIAQNTVIVMGTVTDIVSGTPVPNQSVTIQRDSMNVPVYFHTVLTNPEGIYSDLVPTGPVGGSGEIRISNYDCQQYQIVIWQPYSPGISTIVQNFTICVLPSDCIANFTYSPTLPNTIQFQDLSMGSSTLRSWDFGDGSTSALQNPLHTFPSPGLYTVMLIIGGPGTACQDSTVRTIQVNDIIPPGCVADFFYDLVEPQVVQFNDESIGGNGVMNWNFGDGTTSSMANPLHTYPANGIYNVLHSIGTPGSPCQDSIIKSVIVTDSIIPGCQANFFTQPNMQVPLMVFFNNFSIGDIIQYYWDFGDGQMQVVTFPSSPNVQHQYANQGTYSVCLTIQTNSGCTDAYCSQVQVGGSSPCQAMFTFTLPVGIPPNTIQFSDLSTSSAGSIIEWHWNFGDPASGANDNSSLQNPVHTFETPGIYVVCLTVISFDGCQDTYCYAMEIGQNQGCQAYFHAEESNHIPNLVHFINQSSGNPVVFNWDFGDGTFISVTFPGNPNVDHQYMMPGTYSVCLHIYGNDSICNDYWCSPVVVGDTLADCHASYTYEYISSTSNAIQFTDFSTTSSGSIAGWLWDFGDPFSVTNNTSTAQNPTHVFAEPGFYVVCLTIYTSDSTCVDMYCHSNEIEDNQGCEAKYNFQTIPGSGPLTYQFTDISNVSGPVTWFWNFDDGTTSTEQNPVHTFPYGPIIDPYFVCLTITSIDSSCIDTYCHPVIPESSGCIADFEAHHAPNSFLTMQFEDHSQGSIWTWKWDFGDGDSTIVAFPNNPNVSHTYQVPGYYWVCLTIQGDFGLCNYTYCNSVAAGDSLPECQPRFSNYPDPPNSGNTMHFVDLSSGNPESWAWSFGDSQSGNNNFSMLQNPTHTFTEPGTYYVCLSINGPLCQDTWCAEVEVGNAPHCKNYFTYSSIGQSVNYEGHLLSNNPGSFTWDFGDNQTGVGQNIIHTYDNPGIYYVTLTTSILNEPHTCTYSSWQMVSVGDSALWYQLYGQVFAGTFPAENGMVMLFSMDTNNYYVPFVDVAMLDTSGVYYFPKVPEGNFFIYAIPFVSGYLPTYYGDVLNWENATVVNPGIPANPHNIHLVDADSYIQGPASIHGFVTQGDISEGLVESITMLLKDSNGKTILYSQTLDNGEFNFSQLAYGTYYLYPELAGCEGQTIKIILSEANPSAEIILSLLGKRILGDPESTLVMEAGVVYPNPVKEMAQIRVNLSNPADIKTELFNISGQLIYEQLESNPAEGAVITIPVAGLNTGIYILKLTTDDGLIITRKLVKSN